MVKKSNFYYKGARGGVLILILCITNIFLLTGCSDLIFQTRSDREQHSTGIQQPTTPSIEKPTHTQVPRPSLTPSPKPTFTPTMTQTLVPVTKVALKTEAVDGVLEKPMILYYTLDGKVALQDVLTGENRPLDLIEIYHQGNFLGWTRKGCGFLVRMQNFDIVEVDLQGNIRRKVFSLNKLHYPGSESVNPWVEISPSEEYVAFIVSLGARIDFGDVGGHDLIENLVVMSKDGKMGPYHLTENGHAWNYLWSPDSKRLAFIDWDRAAKFQVYIADLDGQNRVQLSNYFGMSEVPHLVNWSPDGRYFSVVVYKDGWESSKLFIADLKEETLRLIGEFDYSWWEGDSTLSVWIGNSIKQLDLPNLGMVNEINTIPEALDGAQLFVEPRQVACFWGCFRIKATHSKPFFPEFIYSGSGCVRPGHPFFF